jgi:hypothetical protein
MAMFIDSVELTGRAPDGSQSIILWHPSGNAIATLEFSAWNSGVDAAGREAIAGDLLDVLQDGLASQSN